MLASAKVGCLFRESVIADSNDSDIDVFIKRLDEVNRIFHTSDIGLKTEEEADDYMKSKENLMDMLTAYVKDHPEVDIEIIIPQEENIRKLLAAIYTDV